MALLEDYVELFDVLGNSSDNDQLTGGEVEVQDRDLCSGPLPISERSTQEPSEGARAKRRRRISAIGPCSPRELGTNGGIYTSRRRDGRLVIHTILPRIFKSDIRRSYPQMICRIYNSDDLRVTYDLLNTYFSPDVLVHVVGRSPLNGEVVRELTVSGWGAVGRVMKGSGELLPDKCCRMLGAQVRARSDGTGEVHCEVEMGGTVAIHPEQSAPWTRIDPHIGRFFGKLLEAAPVASAHRSPILLRVAATATLVLRLDPDNVIRSVHMEEGAPRVELLMA